MNSRERRQRKDSAESLFPYRGPPGKPGFGRGRGRAMRPMASPPAAPAEMKFEPGKQATETLCDHMEELWVQGEGVDAQSSAGSLATAAKIRDEILEDQQQMEPEALREMEEEICRTMCDIDMASKASSASRATLLGLAQALESQKAKGLQWGLMGSLAVQGDAWMPPTQRSVVLNTTAPFCLVTVGVQGGGKSHTLATVMENCRLNCAPISNTPRPNSTLVFHYDSDEGNCCEAATLTQVRGGLPEGIQRAREDNLLVLVSPSFFRQRWRFYRTWPNCNVIPLLFRWRDLAASEISTLMHLKDKVDDVPLYMAVLLDMLRRYQKQDRLPTFPSFKQDLEAQGFSVSQCAPLSQRLQLLESLLFEAECNQDLRSQSQCSPKELFADSTMVIADMTDPMLAAAEASDIFQVLLRQFLSSPSRHGKLVVFDEAHKYLNTAGKKDELSGTVVQLVRQMRHHGVRVAISTQTPRTLPEELLELVSIAVIHRFHSADWFSYLRKKLPLAEGAMDRIMDLPPGSALVYCGAWDDDLAGHDAWPFGRGVQEMCIRMRVTRDGGVSKMSREPGLT